MRGTQDMRTRRRAAGCGAAVAVQSLELVRIKKVYLSIGDGMDNGPVIPKRAPNTDKNGTSFTIVEKLHHGRPELIQ